MSDRFICIACWQEFLVSQIERGARGGKVVCPHCGYIQTATTMPGVPEDLVEASAANDSTTPMFMGNNLGSPDGPNPDDLVRQTARYEDPASDPEEEENSDPQMGEESTSELPDVPDGFDGEPTPALGFEPPFSEVDTNDPGAPFSESAEVLVSPSTSSAAALSAVEPIPEAPAQLVWQLKTSSGLKLKFNDMESLLGWRQKVSGSKQAEISPDGQRWADFSLFIQEFEETGDPWRAFLHAAQLNEDEPPPPSSSTTSQTSMRSLGGMGDTGSSPSSGIKTLGSRPGYSSDSLQNSLPKATAPAQFTFQVTQKPKSPTGKYVVLGILGVVLLAGAVVALLYFSGQL